MRIRTRVKLRPSAAFAYRRIMATVSADFWRNDCMMTLNANNPIIATQQASLPSAPTNRPITAPKPARAACYHSRPPIISSNNAPRNGPTMMPGKAKKMPINPPTTAPSTPRQVAPSRCAPYMLAR